MKKIFWRVGLFIHAGAVETQQNAPKGAAIMLLSIRFCLALLCPLTHSYMTWAGKNSAFISNAISLRGKRRMSSRFLSFLFYIVKR